LHFGVEKLDSLVAAHLGQRLLQPERLEEILSAVVDRRKERAGRERRILPNCATARPRQAKLKRLWVAIENGVTDVSDPLPDERLTDLKAIRDRVCADGRMPSIRDVADPSWSSDAAM
jgi:hypothetical protein